MKSAAKITFLFGLACGIGLECDVPEIVPDGMLVWCEEGFCSTFCENDLMSPVNGKAEFNCSDYTTEIELPFPTHCEFHRCIPPQVFENVKQSCNDLVIIFSISPLPLIQSIKAVYLFLCE